MNRNILAAGLIVTALATLSSFGAIPATQANPVTLDGINLRIGIKAPIATVYEALTTQKGLSAWWAPATGDYKQGGKIDFSFPQGIISMKVTGLTENKQVKWESGAFPPPWTGTQIAFDLKTEGDYTIIIFTQKGWTLDGYELMAHSSTKWATFLLSLKSLLEDGKGLPSPNDRKIDDWN